ncbi:MAG: phage tail tape measure protein [Proteobacteria bacterium]|nr:phage tail tape measure protein [Pseudomonadota bacterium]
MSGKLAAVDKQAKAFNRSQGLLATTALRTQRAIVGGIAGVASVRGASALVTEFAAAERRLNRIAINADASKERLTDMFRTVDRAAIDYAMSQNSVVDGLDALVASGRSLDDALAFLPSVAATAQASGAEIADIATTADAVSGSFEIAADRMQKAFDILVSSGKQGKFELKDMAQYVPTLAPAFAALGYRGERGLTKLAALLQTVRMRTGGASQAATALQNIVQKMESNDTVKKFGEFGIDLRKEMAAARKDGRDLVDVFVELTEKATRGDLSKIPQLFTDSEFQIGMRALLQGRSDMEGFQQALANVDGSTLSDLNRILGDSMADVDRLAASWDRLKKAIGSGVSGPASTGMDFVSSNMDKAQFINAQLEKEGMGWWDRRKWWAQNGFDNEAQGLKAFQGGWRSPEGLVAAKGSMSVSPELPSRRQDQAGSSIPIPTPRPAPLSMAEQYSLYGRGHAAAVLNDAYGARAADAAARSPVTGWANSDPKAVPFSFDQLLSDLMQPIGSEIEQGGERAGSKITEAARAINEAGGEAANTFRSMLSGMGKQFGAEAAAAFNAGAKSPGGGRPSVNVNSGMTMPNAGLPGGGP